VAVLDPDSDEAKRIDAVLQEWRQGDLALQEPWFIHVGDPSTPLTLAASEATSDGLQALESEVNGLVVVTQTCDVVRACIDRPYVEVAPLVQVSEDDLQLIMRGRRPAYAALPSLEPDRLVADLDRVMTVEKAVVATWTRTPGYADDAEGRAFATALARKRVRFAFPDDFSELVDKLQRRLVDKHEKNSVEGRGLRALREIRVRATPNWDSGDVEVFLWFVREEDETLFEGADWSEILNQWLKLVPAGGRFKVVEGAVVTLDDMTARDYVESDPLDLDHLSGLKP
jgi:hypothetical protein